MKAKNLKRSMVAAATLFALASTYAMADGLAPTANSHALKMSDAQLDQVTAGGAISENVIFNPGNASVLKINPGMNHATCVNCDLGITPPPGTSGITAVVTPSGNIIMHPVHQMPF